MFNRAIFLLLTFISFTALADVEIPEAIQAQIISEVMAEFGYYDAVEVEDRKRLWILAQPQPKVSGEFTDSGVCSGSCEQTGGDTNLPKPRNVKFKGKIKNGDFTQNLIIKWKRPKALPDDSAYKLKNYQVVIAKDGQTFEKYKIKAKYKNNGKPKKHQKIKLRGIDVGDYDVQVRAKYKLISQTETAAAKSNGLAESNTLAKSSDLSSSTWSDKKSGSVKGDVYSVDDLPDGSALKACLLDNPNNTPDQNVVTSTPVGKVSNIQCEEKDLLDSDINLLGFFDGLLVLDIKKNYQLTDIAPLADLPHLSWLNLNWNISLNLQPLADDGKFNNLESLYVSWMGLDKIPQFPESVTSVSLVGNLISDNAGGYIPDYPMNSFDISNNLTYLNTFVFPPKPSGALVVNDQLINNLVNSGFSTQIFKARHTVITDIDLVSGIAGIQDLELKSNSLNPSQNLENFSGFCSLHIESDTLEILKIKRPVQRLNLSDSPSLKNAHVFRKDISHDSILHDYQPVTINLENDIGLNCKSYHDVLENTEARVFDFSVVPSFQLPNGDAAVMPMCPTLNITPEAVLPDYCMPTKIADTIGVHEDISTSRRFITWEALPQHAPDYDKWGITHFKISTFEGPQLLNVHFQSSDEPYVFTDNNLQADQYIIQACTEHVCGYKRASNSTFRQGLTSVTDITQHWSNDNEQVSFQFSYPAAVFNAQDGKGAPDYFRIAPTFNQPAGAPTIPHVDVTVVTDQHQHQASWQSVYFNTDQFIGTGYSIQACRNDLGCGVPVNVQTRKPDPVVTLNALQGVQALASPNEALITLSWNAEAIDTEAVDYIEIIENQPQIDVGHKAVAGASPTQNSSEKQVLYYTDELDKNLNLSRAINGVYSFELRACRRDRESEEGDSCSEPVMVDATVARSNMPNEVDLQYYSNPHYQEPFGRQTYKIQRNGQYVHYWRHYGGGYTDEDEVSYIRFDYDLAPNMNTAADYFYFEKLSGPTQCVARIKKPDPDTGYIFEEMSQFTVQNDRSFKDGSGLSTRRTCLFPKHEGQWAISACFNGIGCGEAKVLDLASNVISAMDVNNTEVTQSGGSQEPQIIEVGDDNGGGLFSSAGGADDLPPGHYWDPRQAGTGWQFHWATHLDGRDPESDDHRVTYDLVAYWFAYSKRSTDSSGSMHRWTPTWYKSKLVKQPDSDLYKGSLVYYENNGVIGEKGVGSLIIDITDVDPTRSSMHVTIDFDGQDSTLLMNDNDHDVPCTRVADNQGILNTDRCTLYLEDTNILLVDGGAPGTDTVPRFGLGNDDDHYSGVWAHGWNDGSRQAEHTLITTIHRGLEVSWVATFDAAGMPIWAAGQSCGSECNRTSDAYFNRYLSNGTNYNIYTPKSGFDPLKFTPSDFWGGSQNPVLSYTGKLGRCFDDEDFNLGHYFLDIDVSPNEVGGRTADFTVGSESGISYRSVCDDNNTSNLQPLTKIAGNHFIGFEINAGNDASTDDSLICNPAEQGGLGTCSINFDWYTNGAFDDLQPFYREAGGDYQLFSAGGLCRDTVAPSGALVVKDFNCYIDGQSEAVTYDFQLRKKKYQPVNSNESDPVNWVPIAQAQSLSVAACPSGVCENSIIVTAPEEVADPAVSNSMDPLMDNQPTAGPIAGSGGVSGGAATYNLPIMVPPGINGMTPEVSINYSSKAGQGTLGVGWSVSAGSAIYLCPKTAAQDGQTQGLTQTISDRFCLDGARLMVVNNAGDPPNDGLTDPDATYWANDAEYRTEIDSFTKITKLDDKNFEVATKSGRIKTYRQQTDQHSTWHLVRESDSHDNHIDYSYTQKGANEWLLSRITYTRHGSSTPGTREVKFNYENKEIGYRSSYVANKLTESTQQLDHILTSGPNGLYRRYDFQYTGDDDLLLLDKIIESAGAGDDESREVLNTQWQGSHEYVMTKPELNDLGISAVSISSEMVTRINQGEAINYVIATTDANGQNTTLDANGNSTDAYLNGQAGNEILELSNLQAGPDIDGDGSKELFASVLGHGGYMVSYDTNGALKGQVELAAGQVLSVASFTNGTTADFNGDGITDMLYQPPYFEPDVGEMGPSFQIAIWNGLPFNTTSTVNFDDYFRLFDTGILLAEPTSGLLDRNRNFAAVDMNSDGFTDVVYTRLEDTNGCYNSSGVIVNPPDCVNKVYYRQHLGLDANSYVTVNGTRSYNPAFGPETLLFDISYDPDYLINQETISFSDLDQDGYVDILVNRAFAGLSRAMMSSGGTTFVPYLPGDLGISEEAILSGENNYQLRDTYYQLTDLNGDGLDDFLFVAHPDEDTNTPAMWKYQLNTGKKGAGLFGPVGETGLGGSANGLPDTEGQCRSVLYGGSSTTSKCSPLLPSGLTLSDVNNDGINDILLPDRTDIMIDVCLETVLGDGVSGYELYNSNIHTEYFDFKICSTPKTEDETLYVAGGTFLNEADFYHFGGLFAELEESVYGHNAYIITPTLTDGDVTISMQKATLDPDQIVYKKLGNIGQKSLDLFGDADTDYSSILSCPFLRDYDQNTNAITCGNDLIEFDRTNQTLVDYALSNYGPPVDPKYPLDDEEQLTAALLEIAQNIAFTDVGEDDPPHDQRGEFFLTINQSVMSGLLKQVDIPAINRWVSWDYAPLSTDASQRAEFPLYTVNDRLNGDSYVDEDALKGEHFYFNSSMYVVSEMRSSTGLFSNGSELESLNQYAYEEAVYNNQGRGFQGFRTIRVRSQPDASQPNNLTESVSTFSQVFPHAGELETIEVYNSIDNVVNGTMDLTLSSLSNYLWADENKSNHFNRGVQFHPPVAIEQLSFHYQLPNEDLITQSKQLQSFDASDCDLTGEAYDAYGNNLCTATTNWSYMDLESRGSGRQLTTESTVVTQNQYYDADIDDWWVDKLKSTTVTTEVTETGSYANSKPSGYDASSLNSTQHSLFYWRSDQSRQLECQFTVGGESTLNISGCGSNPSGTNTLKNTFLYDPYGHVTLVNSIGTDSLGTSLGNRSTYTGYNEYAGYFADEVNNEGLVTQFKYNPNSGQITEQTDANDITTAYQYDVFNHLESELTWVLDESNRLQAPTQVAMVNCDLEPLCDDASEIVNNMLNAMAPKISSLSAANYHGQYFQDGVAKIPVLSYMSQTQAPGAPMVTQWFDQHNQVVLTQSQHAKTHAYDPVTELSTGTSQYNYVISLTNLLGQNELTTEPFTVSSNNTLSVGGDASYPYFTLNVYDQKGRMSQQHTQVGALSDSAQAGETCWRNTSYVHTGLSTRVLATFSNTGTGTNTGTGCYDTDIDNLDMWRSYDAAGQLRQTVEPKAMLSDEPRITDYWYDSTGNPYMVRDAMGHTIITEFDDLGRKSWVDDPNMGLKTYSYNAYGELVFSQDAKQFASGYGSDFGNHSLYDSLGRVVEQSANTRIDLEPVAGEVSYLDTFTYRYEQTYLDASDRRSNESDENEFNFAQAINYDYDQFARLIDQNQINYSDHDGWEVVEFDTQYFYYADYNQLKQTIYTPITSGVVGYSVVNSYDVFGNVVRMTQNPASDEGSDELMRIKDWNHRAQVKTRYLNDKNWMRSDYAYYAGTGQVKQIINHKTGPNQSFDYNYDAWGNLVNQQLNGAISETLKYDQLQRLDWSRVGANNDDTIDYEYDQLGNLTVKSDYASTQLYGNQDGIDRKAGPNAIFSSATDHGIKNYYYDDNGNRLEDELAGVYNQYRYDAHNLMVMSEKMGLNETIEFRYGSDNSRYLRVEESFDQDNNPTIETTFYAGPSFEFIRNEASDQNTVKFHVTDFLTVTRELNQFPVKHFLQQDRLGSTTQILDVAGDIITTKGYDAFGKPRDGDDWSRLTNPALNFTENQSSTLNTDINKRGYTGHEHLDNFQLIHMNGRMYDFNNGRFLSVDPYIQGTDSQAINPYSYIGNNPLSGVDPTGYRALIGVAHLIKDIERAFKAIKVPSDRPPISPDAIIIFEAIDEIDNVRETPPSEEIDVEAIVLETPIADSLPITTESTSDSPDLPNNTADTNGKGNDVPDTSIMNSENGDTSDLTDSERKKSKDKSYDPSEQGSYTNNHESGKQYHGKGTRKRSQQSGRRKAREYSDPHTSTDWTPAKNDREAFKDESKRLDKGGGKKSKDNFNKSESPGKKFREKDLDL